YLGSGADDAIEEAGQESVKVIFEFRQTVCPGCDQFHHDILSDQDVKDAIADRAVVRTLNLTDHPEYAVRFDIHRTPAAIIYDPVKETWHDLAVLIGSGPNPRHATKSEFLNSLALFTSKGK